MRASLEARYFFGTSFSLLGGLFYRNIKSTINMTDFLQRSIDGSTSSTAYGPVLAIGNHWTMGNGFQFGCDWLGVTVPLQGTHSTSINASGASQAMKDDVTDRYESLAKTYQTSTLWTYLNIKIGYSF
jgi:hypothetical protein